MTNLCWKLWEGLARLHFFPRTGLKTLIFLLTLVGVLYPNFPLFIEQFAHYADVESLIQPDFQGMAQINQEIDALLPPNADSKAEFDTVQNFVYQHIDYAYDWDNWGNADYWPEAQEVWQRKREDCDGQAILAVSILRSRGFTSASLVGNFRHIWARVGEVSLMTPDTEQNLRRENGKTIISLPSLNLILQNMAIYWAHFPPLRNLLLFFVTLVLLHHPCRRVTPLLGTMTLTAVGYVLLKDWAQETARFDDVVWNAELVIGYGCFIAAVMYSCVLDRRWLRRVRPLQPSPTAHSYCRPVDAPSSSRL